MEFVKSLWQKFVAAPAMLRAVVLAFVAGFIFGGCACRQWRKAIIEDAPVQVGVGDGAPAGHAFGWRDEPAYVERLVATFARPYFSDAARPLIQGDTDRDAFLWRAYEQVTRRPWRPHDQDGVGSCVGHGASAAVEILSCVQIALGEQHEYRDVSAASIYAFSREVGNFLGNQDGSTGADAAKGMMTLGSLSCDEANDDNCDPKIGAPLCKKWGRTGVPRELRDAAKRHLVKTASRVRTPEEVRAAVVNGYPVTIASSVGFEPFRRDADGFCRAGGTWPHQMCVVGYRKDKRGFLVLQSWGAAMPPGPKSLDQPDGSFWISWRDMQRITSSGECYALSGFDGYPAQAIDVFVMGARPHLPRFDARRFLSFGIAP